MISGNIPFTRRKFASSPSSVTFHEVPRNDTCILTFCIYFTRIPKESKIHLGYISDLHQDTCILCASLVSHWIHIKIHQDTPRYKITIHVSWTIIVTTLQDTIRIHHDTCILDASSEPRWIHTRYARPARDTLQIHLHVGYVSWARSICRFALLPKELKALRLFVTRGYIRDT